MDKLHLQPHFQRKKEGMVSDRDMQAHDLISVLIFFGGPT